MIDPLDATQVTPLYHPQEISVWIDPLDATQVTPLYTRRRYQSGIQVHPPFTFKIQPKSIFCLTLKKSLAQKEEKEIETNIYSKIFCMNQKVEEKIISIKSRIRMGHS